MKNDTLACLTYCGDNCTCSAFVSSMPTIQQEPPCDFLTALKKLFVWAEKNRPNGLKYSEIMIHAMFPDGGYLRIMNEDSITVNFTHWDFPVKKKVNKKAKRIVN